MRVAKRRAPHGGVSRNIINMINGKLAAKYGIEAFVGLTILTVSLRVFSLPLYLITGKGILQQGLALLVIGFAIFFSGLITYKTVRYIHKYLEINFDRNG